MATRLRIDGCCIVTYLLRYACIHQGLSDLRATVGTRRSTRGRALTSTTCTKMTVLGGELGVRRGHGRRGEVVAARGPARNYGPTGLQIHQAKLGTSPTPYGDSSTVVAKPHRDGAQHGNGSREVSASRRGKPGQTDLLMVKEG